VNIRIRVDEWTDRRVGVERFASSKLLLRFLQIAIADVETYGVPENEIMRSEVGALNQINGVPSGVRFISAMWSA
jgi:hypothetical protein